MTVLVLGGSGLLGRSLAAADLGDDVRATAHTRVEGERLPFDGRSRDEVDGLLAAVEPDVVVNAVGERRPNRWDDRPHLAQLNSTLPGWVAEGCERRGAWLVHVSTDYVFDGTSPPYAADDERNPLNPYGETKRDGEDRVRDASPRALVLRVPVLYGPVESADECGFTSMVELARADEPREVDDWAVRRPTFTPDVAAVVAGIIEQRERLEGATAQWSGDEPMTKLEMARLVAAVLEVPSDHLEAAPDPPDRATRPRDTRLDCSLLEECGLGRRTPVAEALPEVLGPWMR